MAMIGIWLLELELELTITPRKKPELRNASQPSIVSAKGELNNFLINITPLKRACVSTSE